MTYRKNDKDDDYQNLHEQYLTLSLLHPVTFVGFQAKCLTFDNKSKLMIFAWHSFHVNPLYKFPQLAHQKIFSLNIFQHPFPVNNKLQHKVLTGNKLPSVNQLF